MSLLLFLNGGGARIIEYDDSLKPSFLTVEMLTPQMNVVGNTTVMLEGNYNPVPSIQYVSISSDTFISSTTLYDDTVVIMDDTTALFGGETGISSRKAFFDRMFNVKPTLK